MMLPHFATPPMTLYATLSPPDYYAARYFRFLSGHFAARLNAFG
jgi:hypothetical protein